MTGEAKNRLPKGERLYLKKDIERLFATGGQSFIAYPLRVVYRTEEAAVDRAPGVAMMAVAPKRRMRHAVGRNRIKRLIRETFRTQKQPLAEQCIHAGRCLHIAFLFVGDGLPTYVAIEKAMRKALLLIQQKTS